MDSNNLVVLCQKIASLIHSVSVYVLLPIFSFISTYIFRLQKFGGFLKNNDKKDVNGFRHFVDDDVKEEEKAELQLKFSFPSFEEFSRIQTGGGNNSVELRIIPVKEINVSKFEEFSENGNRKDYEENGKRTEAMEFAENKEEFLDESQFCCEENSDGFLSDGNFGGEFDIDDENEKIGSIKEIKKLEEDNFLSEKDFHESLESKNDVKFVHKDDIGLKGGDSREKPKPNEPFESNSVDGQKLESLWEHQELIEQLKMELKKVKATGLPTIIEESESPKITDDLKPWKINDELQHDDCMDELHKFYKSYTEMMRKFDILNYQKMYAMGFLQSNDPFQSTRQQKRSTSTLKSLVSQNYWLFKSKNQGSEPIKKFINELQSDLEVVYVGQMCLSWEFLHWQYEKTLDLVKSYRHGIHRYNEVAGEFQQFQVLMQRFAEDEPFRGPRIQSYVKSRCVLRNLLQVPVIREDYLKDKIRTKRKDIDEYAITSEMLVEIMEESIRIFWQLVQSDKDCNVVLINRRKKMPELHTSADLKLLLDIQKILRKKERKLKDILRSENCILRKFRQSKEDDWDQALHFFAQVDMKLVSRVINMSKITKDQLIWCENKLKGINFVNRKMYIESAFLLFPC